MTAAKLSSRFQWVDLINHPPKKPANFSTSILYWDVKYHWKGNFFFMLLPMTHVCVWGNADFHLDEGYFLAYKKFNWFQWHAYFFHIQQQKKKHHTQYKHFTFLCMAWMVWKRGLKYLCQHCFHNTLFFFGIDVRYINLFDFFSHKFLSVLGFY